MDSPRQSALFEEEEGAPEREGQPRTVPPPTGQIPTPAVARREHTDPLGLRIKKRMPALLVTLSIEMVNAAVISCYTHELE